MLDHNGMLEMKPMFFLYTTIRYSESTCRDASLFRISAEMNIISRMVPSRSFRKAQGTIGKASSRVLPNELVQQYEEMTEKELGKVAKRKNKQALRKTSLARIL